MEGRKAILSSLGVALVVAGVALAGSAIGGIVDAPPGRNLTVEWIILGIAVLILGAGTYVFLAALSETAWLPGMKAVRTRAADHVLAITILTLALHRGNQLARTKSDAVTEDIAAQMGKWVELVIGFLDETWGTKEMIYVAGGTREIASTPASETVTALNPILIRLESFLQRCHEVPLKSDYGSIDFDAWSELISDPDEDEDE